MSKDRAMRNVAEVVVDVVQRLLTGQPDANSFAWAARVAKSAAEMTDDVEGAFKMMDEELPVEPGLAWPTDRGLPEPGPNGPPLRRKGSGDQLAEPHPERPTYTDTQGVTHRGRPDEHQPWVEDFGQHDVHKFDLYVWLWRMEHGHTADVVDLRDVFGDTASPRFDGRERLPEQARRVRVGPLLPMPQDLARACQRLGFARLAESVSQTPCFESAVASKAWSDHEAAVRAEAERRHGVNAVTAQGWDEVRMGGPFKSESIEDTIAMFTAGPFGGPTLPEGRVLQPLKPWIPV